MKIIEITNFQIDSIGISNVTERKVKEMNDLGRNWENTRSTVKTLKFEKSQLKPARKNLKMRSES